MPNHDEKWLEKLFSKRPDKIKPGLERISSSYVSLGKPLETTPVILVGGTNGKGTTGGMIACLLSNLGLQVGHYTSPHILSFEERVRSTQKNVTIAELKAEYDEIRKILSQKQFDDLSFFEVTTLLAFRIFHKQKLDAAVIEVGLGGRLDATNILNPMISVICSIDFDHTQWLGNDLLDIAREKLGIARKGAPLLLGAGCFKDARLSKYFSEVSGPDKRIFGKDFWLESFESVETAYITRNGVGEVAESFFIPSWIPNPSRYMLENFVLALASVNAFFDSAKLMTIGASQLKNSYELPPKFFPSSFVGRGHTIRRDGVTYFIDVAHNPAALRNTLQFYTESLPISPKKCVAIVSLLADKDLSGILNELTNKFVKIYVVDLKLQRSADINTVLALAPDNLEIGIFDSFFDVFLDIGRREVEGQGKIESVYIGGSFAAVAEFYRHFDVTPW